MGTSFTPALLLLLLLLCTFIVTGGSVRVNSADELIDIFAKETGKYVDDEIQVLADLDFSSSTAKLTDPLGTISNNECISYRGVLHGNGHVITGLRIDKTDNTTFRDAALFCELKDATIKDLVIDSSCLFAGNMAGALGLRVTGSLTVTNVSNKARVEAENSSGGFIGGMEFVTSGEPTLAFSGCVNEGSVTSNGNTLEGLLGSFPPATMSL